MSCSVFCQCFYPKHVHKFEGYTFRFPKEVSLNRQRTITKKRAYNFRSIIYTKQRQNYLNINTIELNLYFYLFSDNLTSITEVISFKVATASNEPEAINPEDSLTIQEGDNVTIQANSSCNKPGIDYNWSVGRGVVTPTSAIPCTENPYFDRTQTKYHLEKTGLTDTSVAVNVSHPLMWKSYLFRFQGKLISYSETNFLCICCI